jgi:hypothetical protein
MRKQHVTCAKQRYDSLALYGFFETSIYKKLHFARLLPVFLIQKHKKIPSRLAHPQASTRRARKALFAFLAGMACDLQGQALLLDVDQKLILIPKTYNL